ncbi:MAG: aminopeptidase P family protein [Pyrinomonadaceae bacterium]|nr:aminopeptidase P family protein [Pyrinomonadaceae bacterium]
MIKKHSIFLAVFCILLLTAVSFAGVIEFGTSIIPETPPAPKFSDTERQTELAARREKVFAAMKDNSILIMFSAEPRLYTNDVDYVFRQENNLYYLTALNQKNITLVLIKNGSQLSEVLFVPKRDPQRETWNGHMYSKEEVLGLSGIKTIVDSAEWKDFLTAIKEKKAFSTKDSSLSLTVSAENLYLLTPQRDFELSDLRENRKEWETANQFAKVSTDEKTRQIKYEPTLGYNVQSATPIFSTLRLVKSPYEIKLMQHAVDISTEAHLRAMATVGKAKNEYETQAEIEYIFRKRNADSWGYPSIVGCGPNATTLHYEEAQSPVKPGDVMLIDAAAEYQHYTADITRTFPVNGKFSKEQAELYRIVYDAQESAAAQMKPGNRFGDPNTASRKTVEEGLVKLGLITAVGAFIPGTEREIPDGNGGKRTVGTPQSFLWYMHGLGHWIGMNVHDVSVGAVIFKPGMMMTNEPGIYIREDALDYFDLTKPEVKAFVEKIRPAFEKYKNIGVRIEDDMLITETGVEWMSKALPRKLEDVEAFMAKAKKEFQ